MDARYHEPARHHHFRRAEALSLTALIDVLEAARGFAEALAVEIQIGERHREIGYVDSSYDLSPLAILVATPAAGRHGPLEPSYSDTETWIRPRIDREVLDEVIERISRIESGDPEFEAHWERAVVSPLAVRLPEPEELAGRPIYMADNDRYWERIPIVWRGDEAWLAGGKGWRDPLRLEIDAGPGELDVVVDLETWSEGGPGHGDLLAFFARLRAAGFSAA